MGWWCADSDDMMSTTYSYSQVHGAVVRSHPRRGVNVVDIVTHMDMSRSADSVRESGSLEGQAGL